MRQHGFTLIELLIALAIATILAMVAVPAFSDFLARQQLTADVNETISVLSFSRSEAIKQSQPVTVTFSPPDECHHNAAGNGRRWCYDVENEDGENLRIGQSAYITAPAQAFSLTFKSLGDADINDCSDNSCAITISPPRPLGKDAPITLKINTTGSIRKELL